MKLFEAVDGLFGRQISRLAVGLAGIVGGHYARMPEPGA
jgi:hypothetical protein